MNFFFISNVLKKIAGKFLANRCGMQSINEPFFAETKSSALNQKARHLAYFCLKRFRGLSSFPFC